jgi:hypothetical protein
MTDTIDQQLQRKTLLIEENEKIAREIIQLTNCLTELVAKLDSNRGRAPLRKMLPRKELTNTPEQTVMAT